MKQFLVLILFLTTIFTTLASKLPPYPIILAITQVAKGRYKIPKQGIDVKSKYIVDTSKKLLRLDIGELKDGPIFGIYIFTENNLTLIS